MKTTRYFDTDVQDKHPEATPDRVRMALMNELSRHLQEDKRVRILGLLPLENRIMRVILLPDGETIHNAFYDIIETKKRSDS